MHLHLLRQKSIVTLTSVVWMFHLCSMSALAPAAMTSAVGVRARSKVKMSTVGWERKQDFHPVCSVSVGCYVPSMRPNPLTTLKKLKLLLSTLALFEQKQTQLQNRLGRLVISQSLHSIDYDVLCDQKGLKVIFIAWPEICCFLLNKMRNIRALFIMLCDVKYFDTFWLLSLW